MTDDGATLYVYVTIYAAIHCKDKFGLAFRLNPALLIEVSSRLRTYATEKRSFYVAYGPERSHVLTKSNKKLLITTVLT